MTKISQYPTISEPKLDDLLIGTDKNNSDETKNFSIQSITDLVAARPYKVYTALLTQSGTDAPVANVLENTLGDVSFTYEDIGQYKIISDGLFVANKTLVFSGADPNFDQIENPASFFQAVVMPEGDIFLTSFFINQNGEGNPQNGLLSFGTPIEIRVYN